METGESGVKHGPYMCDLLARAAQYEWQGNSHISHVPSAVLQYVRLMKVVLWTLDPFGSICRLLYQ